MKREWKRFYRNNMQQRFQWLNGKWTQTHRCPFCTPKPDADLENQDLATEPSRASGRGPAFSKTPLIFDINKRILGYISQLQSKEQGSLVIQSLPMSINLYRNDKTSFYNITKAKRALWLANHHLLFAHGCMLLTYSITKAKRALGDVAQVCCTTFWPL